MFKTAYFILKCKSGEQAVLKMGPSIDFKVMRNTFVRFQGHAERPKFRRLNTKAHVMRAKTIFIHAIGNAAISFLANCFLQVFLLKIVS